jgi:hypothetical protein
MRAHDAMTQFGKSATSIFSAAMLILALVGMANAGVVGAEGDIYVISHYQLDGNPFFSPAVLQYDAETGELVGPFATSLIGNYMGLAWGPNGNLYLSLMTSTGRWKISEHDGQTGEFINNVVTYSAGDYNLAKGITFGPDGDLYVGNWWLGNVSRYDGTTFEVKASTPPGEIGTPNGMRFNASGELLVISGGYSEVRRYQVAGDGLQIDGVFASTTGSIQAQDMTFGPNGNLYLAMGLAGGVFEYDGVTGEALGEFVPFDPELPVNGLGFDNFGHLLVSAIYPNSRVDAYDAVTGEALGPFLTEGLGGSDAIPTILSIKPAFDATGIDEAGHEPGATVLPRINLSAYPNPFNPKTELAFNLPHASEMTLRIYDIRGAEVLELYSGRLQSGHHVISWDGRDNAGRQLVSGLYFAQLSGAAGVATRRIVLLK